MKKIFLILIFLLIIPQLVYAHCPLCTGAVGAAAVTANYHGLDNSIIGIFIGAFAVSTGLWFGLKVKKKYFRFQLAAIVLLSFLLTAIPIAYGVKSDSLYIPVLLLGPEGFFLNKVYWLNKIILGSILGGIITLAGFGLHNYIKKIKGKVLFPFQGIALTLTLLVITSGILYFITS